MHSRRRFCVPISFIDDLAPGAVTRDHLSEIVRNRPSTIPASPPSSQPRASRLRSPNSPYPPHARARRRLCLLSARERSPSVALRPRSSPSPRRRPHPTSPPAPPASSPPRVSAFRPANTPHALRARVRRFRRRRASTPPPRSSPSPPPSPARARPRAPTLSTARRRHPEFHPRRPTLVHA